MESSERMELVVRTAAKLSPEDRRRVAELILEQDGQPAKDTVERFPAMLEAAEEAVGFTMDRSRDARSVMIRRFIAYRMREEGAYVSDIAQAVGVNHSTVSHYIKLMKACFQFPVFYAKDLELYMRFINNIKE